MDKPLSLTGAPSNSGGRLKKLWTNPNPSAGMGEQSVYLDLSLYDVVLVTFMYHKDYPVNLPTTTIAPVGGSGMGFTVANGYTPNYNAIRRFSVYRDRVTFQIGSFYDELLASAACVPIDIYGVRF